MNFRGIDFDIVEYICRDEKSENGTIQHIKHSNREHFFSTIL